MEKLQFSKNKYIADKGAASYEAEKIWLRECEKQTVVFKNPQAEWGICLGSYYNIHRNWCEKKGE
jgi:hypothetical protein